MKRRALVTLSLLIAFATLRSDALRLVGLLAASAFELARLDPQRLEGFVARRYRPSADGWLRVRLRSRDTDRSGRWYVAFRSRADEPWRVYGVLVSNGRTLVGAHLWGDLSSSRFDARRGACFETRSGRNDPEFAVFSRGDFELDAREAVDRSECPRFQ